MWIPKSHYEDLLKELDRLKSVKKINKIEHIIHYKDKIGAVYSDGTIIQTDSIIGLGEIHKG